MPVMTTPFITQAGLLGSTKVANIVDAAQMGVGSHLPNLDGAMPTTFGPAVIVVTHAPKILQLVKSGEALFKALIERHAKSVDGIDFGYQMEDATTVIGHDKQEIHVPTAASRTPINPSFTFDEVNGNLVWNFFRTWLWLIRDPDTQTSGATTLQGSADIDVSLMSSYAADLCVIQYDSTGMPDNIIDAFFITGFWPQETGLLGVKREMGSVETQTRTIPFHGVVQHNARTRRVGIDIATVLSYHSVNYNNATPITTAIESRITSEGVQKELAAISSEFTPATF